MIFGQRLAESKRGKFCVSPGRCMKDKVSTRVRGRRSQPQREWWKITQSGWEEVGTNHVVVQSLSHVWLTATPWTAPHQAAQFFIISRSLLKLTSIESVMPSNHLILCHPLFLLPSIFPSIRVFSNESVLPPSGQSIGASASASVPPMNIQGWLPLVWTVWSPC